MNNITTIELTPEDAKLFLAFRENQDDFTILKLNGVFDLKNGSMLIHKDEKGKVRKIEINQILYKV